MRLRDILMTVVTLGGIVVGVLLPGPSSHMTPYTGYGMMIILFFSFLGMDFGQLLRPGSSAAIKIVSLTLCKLFVLPGIMWALAVWLAPSWAVPVLILSAISCGVGGPLFAQMLNVNAARVLQLVVVTSLLVPFSLPFILRTLAGAEIRFPFIQMFNLLAMVIFVPWAAAWPFRCLWPGLGRRLSRASYPVSLVVFFLVNLGVFAPYAGSLREQMGQVLTAVELSYLLAVAYLLFAWLFSLSTRDRTQFMTNAVSLVYANNVLALIFASRFLGPKSALLCGAYMLPFFTAIVPLRWLKNRKRAL